MFDPQSDYALNKANTAAIICKSVTGVHTELTCEDFSSQAEFQRWKTWSDEDYHSILKAGRDDDDCFPLNEDRQTTGLSTEDELIAAQDGASTDIAKREATQDRVAAIRKVVTETQYRRLWMRYVDGLSEAEIAALENVSQQRISASLRLAQKGIVNNL